MPKLISIRARPRRRHRAYHRWSAEDKARYLDAFPRSGLSGVAFCRAVGVPLATFAIWQREARCVASEHATPRVPRSRVAFARVAVVPTDTRVPMPMAESRAGIRLVVRGATGDEAALDGVDDETAVRLVALVLGRER